MSKYKAFDKPEDFDIDINIQDLLTYEIANSGICQWININWLQDLWAKRMVKKVERKYKRYIEFAKRLENANHSMFKQN